MPPLIVSASAVPEGLTPTGVLEVLPRNCRLNKEYRDKTIPEFEIKNEFITYASPDSTYAVTRRLLDEAQTDILIGIYDFSAEYMRDILLNAMQRGVKVTLMLDVDSPEEQQLFDELGDFGAAIVEAPSCASQFAKVFPSYHAKVIVIDGTWTLVQSGNYSKNSIPFNETDGGDPDNFITGNRDMGIAIKSKPLAAFFTKILKSDIKLEKDGEREGGPEALNPVRLPAIVEFMPDALPPRFFKSKTFNPTAKVRVQPVLSPDNYMDEIPKLLASAKKSIFIENQYIRSAQPGIATLLEAIKTARTANPELDVRIILGKLFNKKEIPKEKTNIKNIKSKYKLVLNKNIRYIDTTRFVHCHNKLIIIDNKKVLISSQNWSDSAVTRNREAGLIIESPGMAKYYADIFESDWSTAQKKIPGTGPESITPEGLRRGGFIKVVAADYQEV